MFKRLDLSAKLNFNYERLPNETDVHYEFRGLLEKWKPCMRFATLELTALKGKQIRSSELVWRMQRIIAQNPQYVAEFSDFLRGYEDIFLQSDLSAKLDFNDERLPNETDAHYEFRGLLEKWKPCMLFVSSEAAPFEAMRIRSSELVGRMRKIIVQNPQYMAEFSDFLRGYEDIFLRS